MMTSIHAPVWELHISDEAQALISYWTSSENAEALRLLPASLSHDEAMTLSPAEQRQQLIDRSAERSIDRSLATERRTVFSEQLEDGIANALAREDVSSAAALSDALAACYERVGVYGAATEAAELALAHWQREAERLEAALDQTADLGLAQYYHPKHLPWFGSDAAQVLIGSDSGDSDDAWLRLLKSSHSNTSTPSGR
jgi:hypothetical protein